MIFKHSSYFLKNNCDVTKLVGVGLCESTYRINALILSLQLLNGRKTKPKFHNDFKELLIA